MRKLKKTPLIVGLLLMITWGASKKVMVQINKIPCAKYTATLFPSYKDKLKRLNCLTTTNWETFYKNARPLLSDNVSDEELHFIYTFFQKEEEANFDTATSKESKLEVLLLFVSIPKMR